MQPEVIQLEHQLEVAEAQQDQNQRMEAYYRFQSRIYDATRWSFLFGRRQIVRSIPFDPSQAGHILEIGCGTGYNLRLLARRFPKAHLHGIDVSSDMIELTRKKFATEGERITLYHGAYHRGEERFSGKMDVILFSYSLTMINPHFDTLIEQAYHDLKPGGYIAVADFHDSNLPFFKRHMSNHHVRMDGHLLPVLKTHFKPVLEQVRSAYLGFWQYLIFVGKK